MIDQFIKEQTLQGVPPSTIGHRLRDKFNLKVPKLCRVYNLDHKKSEYEALKSKIQLLKVHISKNKKDFVSKRRLSQLLVKLR